MVESRTIHDPFLGKDVQISNRLTDRLRGKYANGPTMPNGEPEFGWRQFETPPIQHKAADMIEVLVKALEEEREYWAGQIASAMIRQDPCDDMQDRCDGITRVLDAVGPVAKTEGLT